MALSLKKHMTNITTPSWFFNETEYAGVEHLDPDRVATYDEKNLFDPSPDIELLKDIGLSGDHTVVDFGAGTGVVTVEVAKICRRVVAVDVSEPMLDVIKEKAEQRDLTNIERVQAGFLTYQHRETEVDFVYSRNALHHLPDFWKMYALCRIADMLKPGGVFRLRDLVFSFEPTESRQQIETWIKQTAGEIGEGFPRSELEAHVREEFSTYSWLLESMLRNVGFEIQNATYRDGIYASYTCIKNDAQTE
jgi:putative AdoMet-dependent methyltransferase